MPTSKQNTLLRKALNHLYNPDYLRNSPLAVPLGLVGRYNTAKLLQEKLINAIAAIKHRKEGSRDEKRIFYHDLLYYRYVQKLSQEEMAAQMGMSPRQFAREQDHAIDLLAILLSEDYPEFAKALENSSVQIIPTINSIDSNNDLHWADSNSSSQPVILPAELEIVRSLVTPLLDQYSVSIKTQIEDTLPGLAVNAVALRQILISLINFLIHQQGGNIIFIDTQEQGPSIRITLHRSKYATAQSIQEKVDDLQNLQIAEKLVRFNKGLMEFEQREDGFWVNVMLPVVKGRVVIVVDDNIDFHQLVQRYTFGTAFQVVCTRNPGKGEVEELAIKHSAGFILLDVMMPEIDGWQILGQLRRHPKTGHIPIIICSILVQEELAYSLGASAYIRKPVTREALIETLERLSGQGTSELH